MFRVMEKRFIMAEMLPFVFHSAEKGVKVIEWLLFYKSIVGQATVVEILCHNLHCVSLVE